MRYRVTRFGSGFEVVTESRATKGITAEMIWDNQIIRYPARGIATMFSKYDYLRVSENTKIADLLNALETEC